MAVVLKKKYSSETIIKKLLLISIALCECLSAENPSVVTKSGKIVGHYLKSFDGNKYEAYQGIPFALPPIGERRFKSPVPIPPWSGELVANKLRSGCWQLARQPFPSGSLFDGDEDCLYLNVFVPAESKGNATRPVLFWIHSGGFQYGCNVLDEESFLMDHDVILVTIQYRLGVFGFLSTKDELAPGNMGLKDQSLALRWVHENIATFGGNPNKITLYGQSAGGISVHYHYLSPMSAGLFQNGISYSGTTFAWWAQAPQNPLVNAVKLGSLMNCTRGNIKQMISCLRKRPARDLAVAQLQFMNLHLNTGVGPFGPVVETSSEDPFVDRPAREIVASGRAYDVPWIAGVTSEEGIHPVAEWNDDATLKEINDNWDELAPFMLGYHDTIPKENHTNLARSIRRQYFGDKPVNRETFMNLVNLLGDRFFITNVENAARAQATANKSPVYYYRYRYRTAETVGYRSANSSKYYGVCHGDDVYLFMKNAAMTPTKNPRDMAMQKDLIKILTSFATDGVPSLDVKWKRVDPTKALKYLDISGPGLEKMESIENLGQRNFWNSIEFQEN